MEITNCKFTTGQVIRHLRFDYRGIIFDMDATFQETDEWYEQVARSRPPKDKPWYHVLVEGSFHTTYVAERHLEPDPTGKPIEHPLLDQCFNGFENGYYIRVVN